MALHEYKKSAKIVEEMTEYLLTKGYKKINSTVEFNDKEVSIEFIVTPTDTSLTTAIKNDLFCCRDIELEEYGWELTGDPNCSCNLDSIGLMVDSYDIFEDNKECKITLHRYI